MIIGVIKETHPQEKRVALIPMHAAQLQKKGFEVRVEKGAGLAAGYPDAAYLERDIRLVDSASEVLAQADIWCAVRAGAAHQHGAELTAQLKENATVIGLLEPYQPDPSFSALESRKITSFAMELIPRTTRAQSMDVLSSMANLAGYKAVIMAAERSPKMFPMMMTAAGTIVPAKVFVLGVGVAGLQAIATAKRLGAVVSAYDVRAEVKEQVESLGAKFVVLDLESASGEGGYAKAMDQAYYDRQRALLTDVIKEMDIVITTANIPGKKAPILLTQPMVEALAEGSVVIDLAAERGGNCALTQSGQTVVHQGVQIVGVENVAATLAFNASSLYSKNLLTFLENYLKPSEEGFIPQDEDDIVVGSKLTDRGRWVHPQATAWVKGDTA